MDKSLKLSGGLSRHNNVLKRAIRILTLQHEDRWEEGRSPFGLPKVANRKAKVGGRTKTKDVAEAASTETPAAGTTTEEEKK
jgi:small basic protein (TIGR04137 family)